MKTVLLATAEPELAARARRWFEGEEYALCVATTGADALTAADDRTDAALLDRRLPTSSGRDVLDGLRRDGRACRVALLSRVEPPFDPVRAGFDEHVERPVSETGLRAAVDRLCSRRRYDELLREYYALSRDRPTPWTSALEEPAFDAVESALAERLASFDGDDVTPLLAPLAGRYPTSAGRTRRHAPEGYR